jgi:hypothetical protein
MTPEKFVDTHPTRATLLERKIAQQADGRLATANITSNNRRPLIALPRSVRRGWRVTRR